MKKFNELNLQLFAEGTEGTTDNTGETTEPTTKETKETTGTESKEFDINSILENPEFKKAMESYADQRVTGAIKKKESEFQKKLEDEKKKASMTAEELQAEKERELAEREAKIQALELKSQKLDYFKEKEYDIELLDFISGANIEEVKANSDALISAIGKIVEKEVKGRVSSTTSTPPQTASSNGGITKEDFAKLGYSERAKLATENPDLYKELTK